MSLLFAVVNFTIILLLCAPMPPLIRMFSVGVVAHLGIFLATLYLLDIWFFEWTMSLIVFYRLHPKPQTWDEYIEYNNHFDMMKEIVGYIRNNMIVKWIATGVAAIAALANLVATTLSGGPPPKTSPTYNPPVAQPMPCPMPGSMPGPMPYGYPPQ